MEKALKNLSKVMGFTDSTESITFFSLLKPYKLKLFLGLIFLLLTNGFLLIVPRLINFGIDLIDGNENIVNLWVLQTSHVYVVSAFILVLAILGAIARLSSRRVLFDVGRGVENDIRKFLFYHLSLLSYDFYEKHSVGDLMTRLTSDINNVRLSAGFVILNLLNVIIVFGGTFPILVTINVYLALAAMLPFVLVIISSKSLSKRMFSRVRENQISLSNLTNHIQENLNAAQTIRVFHQEANEEKKFAQVNEVNYKAALSLARVMAVTFPFTRMMAGVGVAVVFFYGGREVMLGVITLGDYVEVNARLLQLSWPAMSLGFIWPLLVRSRASLTRINEIINVEPLICDGHFADDKLVKIEAKGLSAKLAGQEANILDNINFSLKSSEMLGVVGLSGSGKSTLIRALCREILVKDDQLLYNGVSGSDWQLNKLHRHIALVTSEPFLFSATLRENIVFARPQASDDEIANVIERVGLTNDMQFFTKGLDTMIGERGVMLSGGQRQRIALARALLSNAQVLLLDDCLSAVDSETEYKIIESLHSNKQFSMLIIVSHRLDSIKNANEIIVLDKGKVLNQGTHNFLVNNCKLYSALWSAEQLEESIADG